MRTSSAKNKGRRLCQLVRAKLLEWAPDLQGADIALPATSQPGADLHLSPAARAVYPYAIECKNQESLNIWAALEQARSHVSHYVKEVDLEAKTITTADEIPLLCFTRNREGRTYVALELDHFLKLTR